MKAVKTLIDILNNLGGWPILQESWQAKYFDWINTNINIDKIGYSINSIIQINVDLDARNNSKRILSVNNILYIFI